MINEDVQVDFHCVEVVDGQQNEESYTYPGKFYVKNEKLYVKSSFLRENKKYNTLYILSFLFNTFSLIWLFYAILSRYMLYLM